MAASWFEESAHGPRERLLGSLGRSANERVREEHTSAAAIDGKANRNAPILRR